MADENTRPKGPSEYAVKEAAAKAAGKRAPPRPRTRFFFKLLGLLLLALAGYMLYFAWGYWRKTGRMPDFTDVATQEQVLAQGQKDAEATREATQEVLSKLRMTVAELQQRIHGKPPETQEEIRELVKESQASHPPEAPQTGGEAPSSSMDTGMAKTGASEPLGALAPARKEYALGGEAYALTDPVTASQSQVQKQIRIAAPHFERCLELLDEARRQGLSGPEVDSLEQKAAKRLIDCRRRMEAGLR